MKYNLVGQRFGKLVVVRSSDRKASNGGSFWVCKCDCGNEKEIMQQSLLKGMTISCGCYKSQLKHGMWKERIYSIWDGMKTRCNCSTNKDYPNYGGRGIKVCDEWNEDFMPFYNWAMDNGYKDNLTIDRIDVNGNYEPNNCRWADWKMQSNNRSNTIRILYKGESKTISEWSDVLNVSSTALRNRYSRGWTSERIIETPFNASKSHKKGDNYGIVYAN